MEKAEGNGLNGSVNDLPRTGSWGKIKIQMNALKSHSQRLIGIEEILEETPDRRRSSMSAARLETSHPHGSHQCWWLHCGFTVKNTGSPATEGRHQFLLCSCLYSHLLHSLPVNSHIHPVPIPCQSLVVAPVAENLERDYISLSFASGNINVTQVLSLCRATLGI